MGEQEQAGVHAGLAGADDHVALEPPRQPGQIVERHAVRAVGDFERGRGDRGHGHVHVGGVHDLAGSHLACLAGKQGLEAPVARYSHRGK